MAKHRIVSNRVAFQKTFEKLNRDLDVLPVGHVDRDRKLKERKALKSKVLGGMKKPNA